VVPAREGLRLSFSVLSVLFIAQIGEVVPAREGLRHSRDVNANTFAVSEKWFQQEKD